MVAIRCSWAEGADRSLGLPRYETAGAAGADLRANLPDGAVTLKPLERALISTGLHMEISDGYEVQVRPRSGLALKHGITLVNSPGTGVGGADDSGAGDQRLYRRAGAAGQS